MTLNEFISNLEQTSNALAELVFNEMEEVALESKALLQRRIQEKGTDSHESPLPLYSQEPLPLFFFKDKSKQNVLKTLGIDSSGKRIDKKPRRKRNASGVLETPVNPYSKGISYNDWRVLMGLPVDHVTYTVTGEMWKKIHPQQATIEGDRIKCIVGGDDEPTKIKMGYLAERRGDFMDLTSEEKEQINSMLSSNVFTQIKNRLQQ